ncbi:hypothetical protein, partial [Paracoccus sp. (in: a-proteobacteria)]|uniref:hypothetical protein n=1 Tax=Paracoccus sp. TaxID=267 RepID=UPI0028A98EE0
MPAPVFELALTGSGSTLRATKQDLDTQINAGFLALWNEIASGLLAKADLANSGKAFTSRAAAV